MMTRHFEQCCFELGIQNRYGKHCVNILVEKNNKRVDNILLTVEKMGYVWNIATKKNIVYKSEQLWLYDNGLEIEWAMWTLIYDRKKNRKCAYRWTIGKSSTKGKMVMNDVDKKQAWSILEKKEEKAKTVNVCQEGKLEMIWCGTKINENIMEYAWIYTICDWLYGE